jgi:hypothetical protein
MSVKRSDKDRVFSSEVEWVAAMATAKGGGEVEGVEWRWWVKGRGCGRGGQRWAAAHIYIYVYTENDGDENWYSSKQRKGESISKVLKSKRSLSR